MSQTSLLRKTEIDVEFTDEPRRFKVYTQRDLDKIRTQSPA